MRRAIILLIFCTIWVWSKPNFYRLAQIFGGEISINEAWVSGYIDSEGKLWVLVKKWYTEETGTPAHTSIVILPDGKIDSIYNPPRLWERNVYPYLYFALYDENGNKINDGVIADSSEGGSLIPCENAGMLIIARIETQIGIRIADPPGGYYVAFLLDNRGVVKSKKRIINGNPFIGEVIQENENRVLLTIVNKEKGFIVETKNEKISVLESGIIPRVVPNGRGFTILHLIDSNLFFGWTQVDSVTKFRYIPALNQMRQEEWILIKDKIQIATYDANTGSWIAQQYFIPDIAFRKYEGFELFPLYSNPTFKDCPDVQSVRLRNGKIVVSIFMKEGDKAIAYQMLFDSLGNYIKPAKMEILKPKDINKIPDHGNVYIKRNPAGRTKSGRYKGAYVYIWGYDLEEGMLYWKRYRIE